MSLRLGEMAPDFTAQTTEGEIHFHQWLGDSWGVLYSHPADFTPVCTTELGRTATLKESFALRNTKVIALSVDALSSHMEWIKDIKETQKVKMNFPIIADEDRSIAQRYDMIHPEAAEKFTVRSVFIIDPNKKIRLTLTYPPATGRNFQEIIRVLDSLQLTDSYSVATPVDWKQVQEVVISPALSDSEADRKFPGGYRKEKSYLRLTAQPESSLRI